jgi:hypothetical protein
LKTWPKLVLGSLPLAFALPDLTYFAGKMFGQENICAGKYFDGKMFGRENILAGKCSGGKMTGKCLGGKIF